MTDSKPHSVRGTVLQLRNFLVRLSQWDVLNLPAGSGSDGPYWQGEIRVALAALDDLEEQLQAERREEWREGIVNVLDHEGNYLGCMGSESWQWTLDGGIERMKEQLDSALDLLHRLREWDIIDGPGTPEGEFTADAPYWRGELDRVLSNPAKYPTLDDRNPASVVGVPWNEEGYAGEESTPASESR